MYLEFVAGTCSSKGNPSIFLLKLSIRGPAFCSISTLGTLWKGFLLCIIVFVQIAFL